MQTINSEGELNNICVKHQETRNKVNKGRIYKKSPTYLQQRFSAFEMDSSSFLHTIFLFVSALVVFTNANKSSELKSTSLGPANIHRDKITLSGFSSGGTFAQQLQISHSSTFSGIGVFSHAYYRCGPGDGLLEGYDNACTRYTTNDSLPYNSTLAVEDIKRYRARDLIDDPSNLQNKPLYVYAGTRSSVFTLDTSLGILDVYESLIKNASAIRTRVQRAELVMPTNKFGGPCFERSRSNYSLANCGFSGAFEMLNFILHNGLKEPKVTQNVNISQLFTFEQSEFFKGVNLHYMDNKGFIFMPKSCKQKKCFLHLHFHGCSNGREFSGANYVKNSGFLEVAEANDIIMVFPQVVADSEKNPSGCWDAFGLTGHHYATRKGAQVTVVRKMVQKLTPSSSSEPPEVY